MSGYIGTQPVPQATQHREAFTATASQTTFATVGYTPQFVDVYLNGIHLLDTVDYTATNSSDVVLTTGAAASDVVEIISYTPFEVADQTFTGTTTVTDSGAAPLVANRTASNGDITIFQKDGSTVGSIGSYAGNQTYITSLGGGMKFNWYSGTQAAIEPCATSGAPADNLHDLGGSSSRWQDLYLSGGVYLGGTGAANKLDDYEEGTWTPTFISTGSGPTSITGVTVDEAVYTKIGNFVIVRAKVLLTRATDATFAVGNYFTLGGLPFTANTLGSTGLYGTIGQCHVYELLGGNSNAWGFVALDSNRTNYNMFLQTLNGNPDTGDPLFLDMSYTT